MYLFVRLIAIALILLFLLGYKFSQSHNYLESVASRFSIGVQKPGFFKKLGFDIITYLLNINKKCYQHNLSANYKGERIINILGFRFQTQRTGAKAI
jgi:hypothetical protein